MAEQMTKLRILIASPGDVHQERKKLRTVIQEVSHDFAEPEGLILDPIMWESHVTPGFGKDAQDVVNQQLGNFDIFVGLFWSRLGTPTGRALSGSVEELEWALSILQREPLTHKVLVYFCLREINPMNIDVEQLAKVQKLRAHLKSLGGLLGEYIAVEDLEAQFKTHLRLLIKQYGKSWGNASIPKQIESNKEVSQSVDIQVIWDRKSYRAAIDNARLLVRLNVDEAYFKHMLDKQEQTRIQVHHVLVLDLSGSMEKPDKYPLLIKAVDAYLSILDSQDLVTLIPFSTESEVIIGSESVDNFRGRIASVQTLLDNWPHRFHSTYMDGALKSTISTIREARKKGFKGIERVSCLTDGHLDDQTQCKFTFREFASLEAEINLFGFGSDFSVANAEDLQAHPNQALVRYVPAGGELEGYFAHLARTSQRIIMRNASIQILFKEGAKITCYNAFWCQPHEQHIGSYTDTAIPTIRAEISSVEFKKSYVLLVELRIWEESQDLGTITFTAESQGGIVKASQKLQPTFGGGPQPEDPFVKDLANIVAALVSDDRETQILALRSKIKLYESEGRAPEYINSLRKQLGILEKGKDSVVLTKDDVNYIDATDQTSSTGLA